MYYAEVLLPLNLDKSLTYALPKDAVAEDHFGKRVAVELRGSLYTGLIISQTQTPPEGYSPKEIIEILDREPSVTPAQLKLWQWVAEYYACSLGDVMRAAMPAAMMLESSTRIELAAHNIPENELSDREFLVCEALQNNKSLSVDDISLILQRKNALPAIRKMIGRGLVRVFREYSERYTPKKETVIGLAPEYMQSDEKLKEAFETTSRSEKQRMVLIALLSEMAKGHDFVPKKKILELSGEKTAAIDALVKKGILIVEKRETDRIKGEASSRDAKGLSPEQEAALQKIYSGLEQEKVVLLHGVTGSGKTEIYARLIRETLEKGRQVLYLLPEIALTTQLVNRMKAYFGEKAGVYHSRYNDMQRAEVWQRVRGNADNRFDLILGARSAVFLPFENLGLVIVDEEHEPSYKQQDPAPRYHGRDTAISGKTGRGRYPARIGYPGDRKLPQCLERQIHIGGTDPEVWKGGNAGYLRGGHQERLHFRANERPFLTGTDRSGAICPGERSTGHPIPEPAGLRPCATMPRLRLGTRMPTLRCEPHLPQDLRHPALSLLRVFGNAADHLSLLRIAPVGHERIRHATSRGRSRKNIRRGPYTAHGHGHHKREEFLPKYHTGFRRPESGHPDRHPDDR